MSLIVYTANVLLLYLITIHSIIPNYYNVKFAAHNLLTALSY